MTVRRWGSPHRRFHVDSTARLGLQAGADSWSNSRATGWGASAGSTGDPRVEVGRPGAPVADCLDPVPVRVCRSGSRQARYSMRPEQLFRPPALGARGLASAAVVRPALAAVSAAAPAARLASPVRNELLEHVLQVATTPRISRWSGHSHRAVPTRSTFCRPTAFANERCQDQDRSRPVSNPFAKIAVRPFAPYRRVSQFGQVWAASLKCKGDQSLPASQIATSSSAMARSTTVSFRLP